MAQLPHPRTTTFHRNEQLARTFSCSTDKGLNQLSSPGFLFNFIKSLSFPLFHTGGGWGSTLPLEGSLCNQKWGLAAQQSIKRSGWRNGKLAVFQMPGWHLWGRQPPLTLPVPPPVRAGAFAVRGRGLQAETAPPALTGVLRSVIGGLTSVILIISGTVGLQFRGWFVPVS